MPKLVDSSIIGDREKILIYGQPGSGKTFTALTGPPPTYAIVFGGPNELKTAQSIDFRTKYPELEGQIYYDATVEPQGDRGHFTEAQAFDQACDLLDEALEAERKGDFTFETLVIDSATGLRKFAMNKAMEVNYEGSKNKAKTALKRLRDHNIIIPGDNDYMSEMSLTEQFIEWIYGLDKHVVVVTHEYRESSFNRASRQTTVESVKPLFTGKHREFIPNVFDNVWRFTPTQEKRGICGVAQTVGDDKIYAKTRMGGVLRNMERDPNLRDIISRFQSAEV